MDVGDVEAVGGLALDRHLGAGLDHGIPRAALGPDLIGRNLGLDDPAAAGRRIERALGRIRGGSARGVERKQASDREKIRGVASS